jgi:AraC-like DNA-binding protein
MLTEQQLDILFVRVTQGMESGRYYLRCNLTRDQLASELHIPPHHLSQVFSQKFGKNFHDFINGYRVQSVQERFNDPQNDRYTIEAIGKDCGFDNRAITSRAFRKQIGISPEECRKNIQATR